MSDEEAKDRFLPGEKVQYRDYEWEVVTTYSLGDLKFVTLQNVDGIITIREDRIVKDGK